MPEQGWVAVGIVAVLVAGQKLLDLAAWCDDKMQEWIDRG